MRSLFATSGSLRAFSVSCVFHTASLDVTTLKSFFGSTKREREGKKKKRLAADAAREAQIHRIGLVL